MPLELHTSYWRTVGRGHGVLLASVLACGTLPAQDQAPPPTPFQPVLTSIAALRPLTREQALLHPPVRVRGVVTFKWGEGRQSFSLQDGDAAVWVSAAPGLSASVWVGDDAVLASLRAGMEIELDGVMDGGGYSPDILPRNLRVLGEPGLPPARVVTPQRLMGGAEDSQRVVVSGVVQSFEASRTGTWLLRLDTGTGKLLVNIPADPAVPPERLVDAEVRLAGVAASSRNWRAEYICPRVLVGSSADLAVERAAPGDPFAVPAVPLRTLAGYSPDGRALHRRRIEGTVTLCRPGAFAYLQDGACAVRIGLAGGAALQPGDRVEAAGFIDTSRAVAGLDHALVRKLGDGPPPAALAAGLDDVQAAFRSVREKGRPASPHDYDGLLVAVTGRLLSIQHDDPDGVVRLALDRGGALTGAELAGAPADGAALAALAPGSVVRVVGVALVQYAPGDQVADYIQPNRLDLLLRGAGDVTVLQAPSWWTPARLAAALLGSGAVLAAALAWILALRRALRRRTTRLEEVMRTHRDSELEFKAAQHERQRLAADMHDGLQQLIAGAAFRLEAAVAHLAEIPPAVQEQLTAARGALLRTQEGLRDCVWGLRHVEEGPGEFAALLEHAAASMDHWPRGAVTVRVAGAPFALSRHVMGSLLMLMQEAVGNALRHGRARSVAVRLDYRDDALAMAVADDGAGFEPHAAPGTAAGHFGLESMRHRMSWLGGGVEIASAPGAGATVTIRLPRARAQAADAPAPATSVVTEGG